ncbi:MAG: polysaccharide biosynthesis/export family protein [Chthoniobacterales bacterium]
MSGVSCFFWLAQAAALGAISLLFSFVFSGCQSPADAMRADLSARTTPTHLAAGDLIKLSFPGAPEFNQIQKIRPDGRISLPLIGEVEAAGLGIGEFQSKLARLYKSQLENTEVVVALENRAIPVYVCGAVNRPGKVVIDRPVSALEAIMEAGGFSQTTADMSKVQLIRIENGRHTTRMLNLKTAFKSKQTVASYVKPYDVIYVPESLF